MVFLCTRKVGCENNHLISHKSCISLEQVKSSELVLMMKSDAKSDQLSSGYQCSKQSGSVESGP